MRCKACDMSMHVTFRAVEGVKEPVLEELCPQCLYIIRAAMYDGGPHNELETIACELGIQPDEEGIE